MSAAHEIDEPTSNLGAALHYASKGWRLLPVLPGGKRPIAGDGWPATATNDPAKIRAQWSQTPDANIGVLCDERFGFALDVDDVKALDYLPPLPETLQARTPSGGRHLHLPAPVRDPPLGNGVKGLWRLALAGGYPPAKKTIDIRGRAGFIVVAPSVRADCGGDHYRWINAGTPIAEAPAWLIDACGTRMGGPEGAAGARCPAVDLDAYCRAAADGGARELATVAPGGRGNALNKAAYKLGTLGMTHDQVRAALLPACDANGLIDKDGNDHVEHELLSGWTAGNSQPQREPKPREIDAKPKKATKPKDAGNLAALPSGVDTRPIIRIGPELHDVVDRGIAALASDDALYQRDGELVRVVHLAEPEALSRGRGEIPAGTPQIRNLSTATLRERLTGRARWQKFDGRSGEWVRTIPADTVVKAVADRGEWLGIRSLVSVCETPIVQPDFVIATEPGCNAATGCIYMPSCALPPILTLRLGTTRVPLSRRYWSRSPTSRTEASPSGMSGSRPS
ncbi:MAG: bifunctional DNA primase/polymerase [Myxococcota bacterium]